MRLGAAEIHENLAFIPVDIPSPGEGTRSTRFGMVREGGQWKLLTVGLLLLDIPALEVQWEKADLEAREETAIEDLRDLTHALDTYRNAFGLLPESLTQLGPAPPGGISPDAAGMIDADLAAGSKDGYTFRYRIVPAANAQTSEDANKKAGYELAATPYDYGKTGKRSFFLDSSGILRGADKQGVVATSDDPRIDSPTDQP